jgi:hypothetical protein
MEAGISDNGRLKTAKNVDFVEGSAFFGNFRAGRESAGSPNNPILTNSVMGLKSTYTFFGEIYLRTNQVLE